MSIFSNLIFHKKELIIKLLQDETDDETFFIPLIFAKFLVIQLKILNKQSHVVPLRMLDYFTDPKSYINNNNKFDDINKRVPLFIFNHLIKNEFIKQIVLFSIQKIPDSVKRETKVPLADSIGQLLFRSFIYLNENTNNRHKERIVKAICFELFAEAFWSQIKNCLIPNISQIIKENKWSFNRNVSSIKESSSKFDLSFIYLLNEILELNAKHKYQKKNSIPSYHQQEQQQLANKVDSNWSNSKNNIMIMYSVLSVYSNVLESFTNDEFNEYLSVLRYLIENSSKIYI
jgi:hypothetical protein